MSDSSPKLELPKPKAFQRDAPGVGGKAAADSGLANTSSANPDQPNTPRAGVAQAGDARPDITQLVLDHHEILYRYAYRLTGSVADAEDLTQQTFLVAHEKLGQVRQAESVRGWLFTVLRNGYLKNCRRTVPMAAASLGFDLDTVAAKADDTPLDTEQLQSALGTLADEFKLVLLLFYFEQRSYREIAKILQLPIGTVMSRLSRAKSHLRSKLFPSDKEIHKGEIHKDIGIAQDNGGKANRNTGGSTDDSTTDDSNPDDSGKVTIHA